MNNPSQNPTNNSNKSTLSVQSEQVITAQKFPYMMLGRLKSDCEYFLGFGCGSVRHLWAGDIDLQIAEMKRLWNSFANDKKPQWLSLEDINQYELRMKAWGKNV